MPQPTQSAWQMLGTVVILILVLVACYFVTRFIATRMSGGGGKSALRGNYMRILDRIVISRDKYVMLVEVGERILLIGVGESITTLCELDAVEPLAQEAGQTAGFVDSFRSVLQGRAKKPIRRGKDVEEYIRAQEGGDVFAKVLRDKTLGKMEEQSGEFSIQLDDLDGKMKARNEKLRGRNDHE